MSRRLLWACLALAVLPSVLLTAIDTWLNPGAVFRQGWRLHGSIVWDTLWSWLWPLSMVAALCWLVVELLALAYRRWRQYMSGGMR